MSLSAQRAGALLAVIAVAVLLLPVGVSSPPPKRVTGFLGVEFAVLTPGAEARAPFLGAGGALISNVYPGGPASSAGIPSGAIVTAIDHRPVSSAADAAAKIANMGPGRAVTLTLYDRTMVPGYRRDVRVALAEGPAPNKNIFTVEPPRMLAREWDFEPSMAARAAWSHAIARGAVDPLALQLFSRGRCQALAPEDWVVADTNSDGTAFALVSQFARTRAIFAAAPLAKEEAPEATVSRLLAKYASITPELSASENATFGYRVVAFGSRAGYSGFVLYHTYRQGRVGLILSVRAAVVPSSNVAEFAPLAGAVALSIRCGNALSAAPHAFDDTLSPTSVSVRCLKNVCDESDYAGAYNDVMHTGYVHAPNGQNFLIDVRKDIWLTGPAGPGTYRQVRGMLEKLEPGRTN